MKDALLRAVGTALDGLEVALCVFDHHDRTLAWNNTFLAFFPEHEGHVHLGEPYADNLRRFYQQRLAPKDLPRIERFVAEGVARHQSQQRPYEFDHADFRVRVSSIEMGRFGRVRVWRKVAVLPTRVHQPVSSTKALAEHNARAVLERLSDGVIVVDVADRAMWANRAFTALYRLPHGGGRANLRRHLLAGVARRPATATGRGGNRDPGQPARLLRRTFRAAPAR
jgi:PAS domain-containing protein